jgi:hypothetical protein
MASAATDQPPPKEDVMSERNGDRARFQKNRRHKLKRRQRIQALAAELRQKAQAGATADTHVMSATASGNPRESF